jgi:hypothetical protein
MKTKLWTMSSHAGKPARSLPTSCDICYEVLGKERLDGRIEYASILPCSHVFGSICILLVCLLETSLLSRTF